MNALCRVRFVRYNLLWPICSLACGVSCLSTSDDRRLHRPICYIHRHPDKTLQSFIVDNANDLAVMSWVDASLADDLRDSNFTNGAYLDVVGPNSICTHHEFRQKNTQLFFIHLLRLRSLRSRKPFVQKVCLFSRFGRLWCLFYWLNPLAKQCLFQ